MFCMKCGTQLDDTAKFCYKCGSPVGTPQPPANDESTVLLSSGAAPADDMQTMHAQPVQTSQSIPQPPQTAQPAPQFVSPMQPPVQQTAQPLPEYPSAQYVQPAAKTKSSSVRRNVIILAVVLMLLVAGAVTALFATGAIGGNNPDKIMETAERYLDEKDYKEAIVQFEKLLEIDPMNVDAYLGLAEAYEAQGDIDKAIEVLEDALKELEDKKDIKKIEKALDKLLDKLEDDEDEDDDATAEPVKTASSTEPAVSEPEPVLFDVSTAAGNWCSDDFDIIINIELSDDYITIDRDGNMTEYTYLDWELSENGFIIDSNSDKIEFVYDAYWDEMSMLWNGEQFYLERGIIEVPKEGKVLNIWCWNDEFYQRVKQFYPGYVDNGDGTGTIDGVKVRWTFNSIADNAYQIFLDRALLDQDNVPADEKIDIFLIEADYADKYVNSSYSLPVSDVGITDADTAQMYAYTKEIATDKNGALKAVSWQACPGLFAYRRSIANEVLGTDDPTEVQEFVANWDQFDMTAKRMKDAGYYMLSGYDDAYRTFSNNVSAPWVNDNKEIVIDENLLRWVEQTKMYTDNGYNNRNWLWSEGWAVDQGPDGKVFGFFYSTWGIDFTLMGNAGDAGFGDWAVCYGPQSFYWGGTWLCAGYQTDNPTLVHDIMYNMTCNADIMKSITLEVQDYTNNMTAMDEIAASDFRSDFLGGQNHIALFTENAKKIDMSNISPYDQGLTTAFQNAFRAYFDGAITYDEALEDFYDNATVVYPDLIRP